MTVPMAATAKIESDKYLDSITSDSIELFWKAIEIRFEEAVTKAMRIGLKEASIPFLMNPFNSRVRDAITGRLQSFGYSVNTSPYYNQFDQQMWIRFDLSWKHLK